MLLMRFICCVLMFASVFLKFSFQTFTFVLAWHFPHRYMYLKLNIFIKREKNSESVWNLKCLWNEIFAYVFILKSMILWFVIFEFGLWSSVENLTFMLAQYLTAVKDVIFFWPITKEDRIYNLLTGKGGSVLWCSQINLLRRERRGAFTMFTSCQNKTSTDFLGLVCIPKRDRFFGTYM